MSTTGWRVGTRVVSQTISPRAVTRSWVPPPRRPRSTHNPLVGGSSPGGLIPYFLAGSFRTT
jgi:hypothetical protein